MEETIVCVEAFRNWENYSLPTAQSYDRTPGGFTEGSSVKVQCHYSPVIAIKNGAGFSIVEMKSMLAISTSASGLTQLIS